MNQISDIPSGEFVDISAGYYHSCAIDVAGNTHCWGVNGIASFNMGQVSATPMDVFMQISSGAYHNCAINSDTQLTCWGEE